ncbi:PREDICTED: MADS-box protein AGL42-like [Tarenaya hassleriana]|uniref:MADS-box protein AGL42-like n=1 Tax=Tarenaya hassleriana TaxID=28532 RepID=UPI00053C24E3|nr:PREDICTED: MADS-box protein AGL42-like [Tarenaya hassleriana]XP_010546078.1 PREDICTED: MADS-box protein AGL42-like [Tarenaya hassleriana]
MVRGKIEMKKIENATSRQVTFSKRRNGLLKKAYELSVLCDAEVSAIIFSQKGRLFEFSSSDTEKTIERYRKCTDYHQISKPDTENCVQRLKQETTSMMRKIELLELQKRKLLGQGIASCSINELHELDNQIQRSLINIRARKAQLFNEQMEKLKEKEKMLLEENTKLCQKYGKNSWEARVQRDDSLVTTRSSEVKTDLIIGLPERCS